MYISIHIYTVHIYTYIYIYIQYIYIHIYLNSDLCLFFRGARNGTLPPIDNSEFLETSNRPRESAVCNPVGTFMRNSALVF